MNKEQVYTLLKSVKADIVLYQANRQLYVIDRAIKSLNTIKQWQQKEEVNEILKSGSYKLSFLEETKVI